MIAVYGGSFNPPTFAHMKIMQSLSENEKIDKVLVVPVGDKYSKKELISSSHRVNMLELATKNMENVTIEKTEIMADRVLDTYETLSILSETYPGKELAFILGADNLKDFLNWDAEEILRDFNIIVIERDDKILTDILFENDLFKKYSESVMVMNLRIRENISSTKVREQILENSKRVLSDYEKITSLRSYIDYSVYKYIDENKLYA